MPKRPAALFALAALVIGGCARGTPGEGGTIEGTTVIVGGVSAGEPLAGATVTLRDVDGKPIDEAPTTTTAAAGTFALEATDLPRNFEVAAEGGQLGGRIFAGTLVAPVRSYEPGREVRVNAGTTIVAAYLEVHPDERLGRATGIVSRFLGIPPTDDFALHVSATDRYFDQSAFLAQAAEHGGIARFAAALVGEIDSGRATHAFPGKATNEPALDIAKFVFDGLRADANSPACLNDPTSPQCPPDRVGFGGALRFLATPTELALADITAKLDRIASQLAALNSVVNEIKAKVDQNTYNDVIGFMNPPAIERAMTTLQEVTAACATSRRSTYCQTELGANTAADPGELRKQIRSLINAGIIDGILARVSGAQGTTGVMQVWPNVVKNDSGKFFKASDSQRLLTGLDYFYDLEMAAITLAVNYWRWEGRDETKIQADIAKFENAVKQQQTVFSPLPAGTVFLNATGRMWTTALNCSTYAGFGPRETNQCPATYAGFPIRDHRKTIPSDPANPFDPYWSGCSPGYWCVPLEGDLGKLLEGATAPWSAWLKNTAGITVGGPRVWLNNLQCGGQGSTFWVCCPPRCALYRRYADLDRSLVGLVGPLPDPTLSWYLLARFPNESARYF